MEEQVCDEGNNLLFLYCIIIELALFVKVQMYRSVGN